MVLFRNLSICLFSFLSVPPTLAASGTVKVNLDGGVIRGFGTDAIVEDRMKEFHFDDNKHEETFRWYGDQWGQNCRIRADDGFDGSVEFTLRLKKNGLEGPKDGPAHIKCTCSEPGNICDDVPKVDSTS